MADPVWGLLPKAQDDPQLITEAITAAIAAHEADPEAHLGDGESLQTHRTNDVLDHPHGAALADKLTMTEVTLSDNFANLDRYSLDGDVENDEWPGARLYVERGAVNISKIYAPFLLPSPYLSTGVDLLFQLAMQWVGSTTNHLDIDLGFGVEDGGSGAGMGFFVHNGVVKGILATESNQSVTADLGIDITFAHVYRAQYIASEETAYFFVDGVQKATLAMPAGTLADDGNLTIKANVTGTNDGNLRVDDLYTARSVN